MFQLNYGRFRVHWNSYRPVELKRFMESGYQLTKNVGHYGCLTKKNCQLKLCLQWLQILLTFVRLANVSFRYKSGFLRNCLRLTWVFEFSISLRNFKFRCGFYFFNAESWCLISGIFRINERLVFYLKLLCKTFRWKVIECKFKWHFLFLQFNPFCFKTVLTMMLGPI